MPRRPCLAALAALAAALAPPAPARAHEPAAAAADEAVASLRFAWPAPLRARVSYRRTKLRPGAPRSAFTARWETRVEEDGGTLRVTTRGTTWRGDLPYPRALARDAIRASEEVVQRVGAEGEFRDLEGLEAMRAVLARVFAQARLAPEEVERAVPHAEAALRAEAEELWNLAVGFWTGADLRVGETYALVSEAEVPLLPGVRLPHTVEFAVRRRVPCAAGERARRCVEAVLRATPERDGLERVAEPLLARLSPAAPPPAEAVRDLAAESELLLVTDPATLLPRRVVWTKAVRLGQGERGAAKAELVDRSEYDYRYLPPAPPARPRPRPRT
jgi:hypothetical protein